MTQREKVVATAQRYIGCKESNGSHKKIIDIYNGHKPLARGYAVKYTDETFAEIFLLKMGAMIENEGYDACLQRFVPGFKVKGDKSTNPEVSRIYELEFASPVADGKPAPDVIIDYNKAAVVCGLGSVLNRYRCRPFE